MVNKFDKQWSKMFEESPELQCKACGVIFKDGHDCDYQKLKDENIKMRESWSDSFTQHLNRLLDVKDKENDRLREALNSVIKSLDEIQYHHNPPRTQRLVGLAIQEARQALEVK